MLNQQEAIHLLKGFGFPAEVHKNTVQVNMEPHNEENKVTREEIHAALQYKVNMTEIRQINPWIIVITF